ncbi:androgen-dependent TFPI-regulating protein isoform X2 [Diachasma alloeum]|uniref:androgen-dependent TFPI-regulating protein isoform X2 n=1 Tax=Diachasma alloeum TaxID=454923 RepID=UPI00073846B8|nr:androgen-dependent TFPI-regulating protein isoform X2 [Diachasma alloeum]XP_015113851.1 androgen-dependent TFPI-regulating protein isoform X2 [Diachasma alloeum]XP_015113852.1 androgen-dependent TFPI-regulating protein isoform X2 [Diachasma alloeum]XP_015113853.1 androgen-dependent TFPI-regulating protein isoform X2 [Diachasma alloeum]XP_015113854.1 androgen-dependent TFPI-regulating protein isoform X2 [Diachasma alloeum]
MGTLLNLFHLTAFTAYGFTLYEAFFDLHIPMLAHKFKKFDPGQFKYLTIWGVIAQSLFFFLCILNDLYGSSKIQPKKAPIFRRIKDYFHAAFSFPLAMFVGITFWALMFVDRELVLPKALDPYFPWWLNHLMHTMIMVSTVIEMLVAPRQYPKRLHGLGGLGLLMLTYLTWLHFIYYKSGIWVYPVLEVLSIPLRIVFHIVLFVFCCSLYFVGEFFDHLLWGTIKRTSSKTSKKKKTK